MSERIFAACAPGLEDALARELAALGLDARALPGGAEATGQDAVAVACLASRAADAVALRAYIGPEEGLDRAVADARRRFGREAPLAVRRRGRESTVSIDAVGEPLYRRGWRARVGAAPLRESIAAGMLLEAGYDGSEPFLDPMCGSGTIVLEAAAIAARRAPGVRRTFAFEAWPGRDPARAAELRARLLSQERPPPALLRGSDRNAGALRLAQKNAAAAGMADAVALERRDAGALAPPPGGPGLLAVNPPYGVRLEEDPAPAWRALDALMGRLPGWRAAVLAPDRGLASLLSRRAARAIRLRNGGLACQLLLFDPA